MTPVLHILLVIRVVLLHSLYGSYKGFWVQLCHCSFEYTLVNLHFIVWNPRILIKKSKWKPTLLKLFKLFKSSKNRKLLSELFTLEKWSLLKLNSIWIHESTIFFRKNFNEIIFHNCFGNSDFHSCAQWVDILCWTPRPQFRKSNRAYLLIYLTMIHLNMILVQEIFKNPQNIVRTKKPDPEFQEKIWHFCFLLNCGRFL